MMRREVLRSTGQPFAIMPRIPTTTSETDAAATTSQSSIRTPIAMHSAYERSAATSFTCLTCSPRRPSSICAVLQISPRWVRTMAQMDERDGRVAFRM